MSLLSEVYPIKNNLVTTDFDLDIYITSLNDIINISNNTDNTNKFLNVKIPCIKDDIFTYEIFNENGRIISGKIDITNNSLNYHTISIPIDLKLQYFIKIEYLRRSRQIDSKNNCFCKFFKYETDNNEFKLFPHYTDSDDDNCEIDTDNDFKFCNNFIKNIGLNNIGLNNLNEGFMHNTNNIKCINIDSDDEEPDNKSDNIKTTNESDDSDDSDDTYDSNDSDSSLHDKSNTNSN